MCVIITLHHSSGARQKRQEQSDYKYSTSVILFLLSGVIVGLGKELVVEPTEGASGVEDPHRVFSSSLIQHPPRVCGR